MVQREFVMPKLLVGERNRQAGKAGARDGRDEKMDRTEHSYAKFPVKDKKDDKQDGGHRRSAGNKELRGRKKESRTGQTYLFRLHSPG